MSEISEFAVRILKQYALENQVPARSTSDLSPLEEWLILRLFSDSRWIRVSDRLPENRERVLCYNGRRMIESSWCAHTDHDDAWFKRTFTHWHPNIEPPTSDCI